MCASSISKELGHDDKSGFDFSQELLNGEPTAAINFDRLQKHPEKGYVIFEYLLCDEKQSVTPYTSHPNKYWNKNSLKFLSLWRAALEFSASLYLVNYAKKGTKNSDEVLVIQVLDMDQNGITKEKLTKYTRKSFAQWFRDFNKECLCNKDVVIDEIYSKKSLKDLGLIKLSNGKYKNKTISEIYEIDKSYLEWLVEQKNRHIII